VCENPFNESSIKLPEEGMELEVEKEGSSLREFEAQVNEDGGCWLYFEKLPPPEEDDPKKKAPPKGKAPVEELKPVKGKAWVDLIPFQWPGGASSTQRSLIETVHPEGVESQENVFEPAQTYVSF